MVEARHRVLCLLDGTCWTLYTFCTYSRLIPSILNQQYKIQGTGFHVRGFDMLKLQLQ